MPPMLSRVKSFLSGFARGLAAPYRLHERFSLSPVTAPQALAVKPTRLHPHAKSDWEAIGADLRMALSRYEWPDEAQ